jgi:hypothetical protein
VLDHTGFGGHESGRPELMSQRAAPVLLAGLALMAVGCGGDSPSDPGSGPAAVASIHIIAGDGQTDTAGATLPTAVVIEVLDVNGQGSPGRTVVLSQAGAEPNLNYQSENPSGDVVTDSAGRAEIIWRVYGLAGTRHLIASVLGSAAVGKDTITATVLPAGPYQVEYAETEVLRLLGEPADLAANIVSVTDSWGNPVAVQTVTVDAPAPLQVSGQTTVSSQEETDTTVTLRINGVAFPQRVVVLRSIQEFIGAVGDWTCSSEPGSPWVDTPGAEWTGRYLRTQVGHFVVDSITRYGDYSSKWTLHLSTALHQTFDDGEIRTVGPFHEQRYVLYQVPHGFLFPYGPQMDQTGTNPIKYTELFGAEGCIAWNGPSAHLPLTITLTH